MLAWFKEANYERPEALYTYDLFTRAQDFKGRMALAQRLRQLSNERIKEVKDAMWGAQLHHLDTYIITIDVKLHILSIEHI